MNDAKTHVVVFAEQYLSSANCVRAGDRMRAAFHHNAVKFNPPTPDCILKVDSHGDELEQSSFETVAHSKVKVWSEW